MDLLPDVGTPREGGYGSSRFLAHNRYLHKCLQEDPFSIQKAVKASELLSVEKNPEFFVKSEHSYVYEFADGRRSGNFCLQLDNFVTVSEARRIIDQGVLVKAKASGEEPDVDSGRSLVRKGTWASIKTRGGVAFDMAYIFSWHLLERAKPWLPVAIHAGQLGCK